MPIVSTKLFSAGDYGARRLSTGDLKRLQQRGNAFVKAGVYIPVAPRFRDAAGMDPQEELERHPRQPRLR